MLVELEDYYRNNGIAAEHFTCAHQSVCCAGCSEFTGPKEAYVGPEYEQGTLPRLLFLSLDSGHGRPAAEQTLLAVRERELRRKVPSLPEKDHWYRTHELAWTILSEFDSSLNVATVTPHFAHTNSAKCCQNKPGNRQADRKLFRNCRQLVRGELQLLLPQILVTQGDAARKAVAGAFEEIDAQSPELLSPELHVIRVHECGSTLWIPTPHPRACRPFYDQYWFEWGSFASAAANFVRHGSFRSPDGK